MPPHCDNPPCCNPRHLYAGTPLDNVVDKVERGRLKSLRGSKHPVSKLDEERVALVKQQLAAGEMLQREIAALHGISRRTVSHIACGYIWRHVA